MTLELTKLTFKLAIFGFHLFFVAVVGLSNELSEPEICRTKCRCDDFGVIECQKKNLTEVPLGISTFGSVVNLFDNQISNLDGITSEWTVFELNLAKNRLTQLPPNLNIKHLLYLCLGQNPLTFIPGNSFVGVPNLVYLSLSHSSLTVIKPSAFRGLYKLRGLNLAINNLKFIPDRVLDDLENLSAIYLFGNPWDCSCSLRNFWKKAKAKKVVKLMKWTYCASPEHLKARSWDLLTESDFGC